MKGGPFIKKWDLLLQSSGHFLCEGGSSKPTEPPWLRACCVIVLGTLHCKMSAVVQVFFTWPFTINYPSHYCANAVLPVWCIVISLSKLGNLQGKSLNPNPSV